MESYVFRTLNLKDFVDQELLSDKDKLIEISVPIFFKPLMSQILSIGKSIKIVKYLDS